MEERATYQIGDIVQAYDGSIGRVVYTHQRTDTAFPDEQQVWIKCSNGKVMDAAAVYFQAAGVNHRTETPKKAFAQLS